MATEEKTDPAKDPGKTPEANKDEKNPIETEKDLEKVRAAGLTAVKEAAELKEKLHAANEEAKKHRLEAKASKSEKEKFERAWKIANGEEAEAPDPVKLEKEKTSNQMRKLYLKSAFVSEAAKDMHDADFSFDAVANEFSDVEVDIATGKVDKAALKTKVAELKKARPFLFAPVNDPLQKKKEPAGQADNGVPAAGGSMWMKWQEMQKTDRDAATKFYKENRKAIGESMPK